MKSRTSFFNFTLFKKDITRFAPLWALYAIGMSLTMLTTYNALGSYFGPVRTLGENIGYYSIYNLFYGALVAQLLFGDLFNARLCNGLHAMPMTREERFGSHIVAGLAFSIVPNLVVSLLMIPAFGQDWYLPFAWLGSMTLQYLFFYGAGVLAVFCTGNRFAMAVVYAILNFGSVMVYWFAETVYLPMMNGVVLETDVFGYFSPIVQMISADGYFVMSRKESWYVTNQYVFRGLSENWNYLLIYAGVGLMALAVSLLLYRKRALESAGDFIAVKCLRPVFLVLYTLCAGAFLAVFGDVFTVGNGYLVFLIVGLIVGLFTGKMLLERSTRVFGKKSFLHLAVMTAVILLSLGVAKFDLLGIVGYVPDGEDVSTVTVHSKYGNWKSIELDNPEEIADIRNIHRLSVEQNCEGGCGREHFYVTISYALRNGQKVTREYILHNGSDADSALKALYASLDLPAEVY